MANSLAIFRQSLACLPVLLNMFIIGLGHQMVPLLFGYRYDISEEMDKLLTHNKVNDKEVAPEIVRAVGMMGKIFATLISPVLVDKFGRRISLNLVTAMLFGASLLTIVVPNLDSLQINDPMYLPCAINAMFNFAYATNNVVSGIYVVENCSPKLHGIVGSGTLLMFAAGSYTHYTMSRSVHQSKTSIAITNAAITICVFPTLYYSIETPSFLAMNGHRRKAEQNLLWLSGSTSHTKVMQEIRTVENILSDEKLKRKSLRLLFSTAVNWKGLLVVLGLHIGMWNYNFNLDSVLALSICVLSYNLEYFKDISNPAFVIMAAFATVCATLILGPFIIEWIDRRSMVITCYFGIAIINFSCYLLCITNDCDVKISPSYDLYIKVGFCVFYLILLALMYSAIYALKEELLPFSVRAIGSSIGALGLSFSSLYRKYLYDLISVYLSEAPNFLIFALLASLSSIIIYIFAPKPTGKTLHELENLQRIKHVDTHLDDDVEEETTRL